MNVRIESIVRGAFGNNVNLEKMNFAERVELSRTINYIESLKETYIRLSKEHPALVNGFLRMMGNDIKCAGRKYNAYMISDEKIMFSGLLGKYMREIKNASVGVLTQ